MDMIGFLMVGVVLVVTAAIIGARKSRNGLTYLKKRHRWEYIGS